MNETFGKTSQIRHILGSLMAKGDPVICEAYGTKLTIKHIFE